MTLRERIADWISGGALRRMTQNARDWRVHAYEVEDRLDFSQAQAREQACLAYLLQEKLNRIAACETEKGNATVRRMARIAREIPGYNATTSRMAKIAREAMD